MLFPYRNIFFDIEAASKRIEVHRSE